ncbi:trichohyalin-like [Acanthaster planci]|uniref:Trichohyalin-like n=1 Tax=Acanthaster planci TaxID=133434 RepID=A0A8B8A385_ACAPL|nr:trichohyalin-like [Acanthaster planci]
MRTMSSGKLAMPFDAGQKVKSRYETLASFNSDEGEEAKEYAAFLREQERKCGPEGFLDSKKYTHSFQVRGKVLETKSNKPKKPDDEEQPKPTQVGLLGVSTSTGRKPGQERSKMDTVVDLLNRVEKDKEDYEKRMKIIEDHMWQHKQEERELKRSEGDIIKSQHMLRRTMKDFELAINRKKQAEAKKILENKQKEFLITNDHIHKKENLTKDRIEKAINKDQQIKDEDRKSFLTIGDLERKYRAKIAEIELRRAEVQKLSEEFTDRMKTKEEETFALNKELAEIALTINMEAQKQRKTAVDTSKDSKTESKEKIKTDNEMETHFDTKLRRNVSKAGQFENNKRRLSLDLAQFSVNMLEKNRDGGRQLLDTRNRLQENSTTQRKLQEAALTAKLDHTNKKIEQKLRSHDLKKQRRLQHITALKKKEHEKELKDWEERFSKKQYDATRREYEDTLKHAVRTVTKQEEIEHDLSTRVRTSEYARKQREQQCKRMQQQLAELRRKNDQRLKQQMIECYQKEKELEQKLLREQSELYKSHVNREEGYVSLQQHRMMMKEDRIILNETAKEHERLVRIGEKTDLLNSYP